MLEASGSRCDEAIKVLREDQGDKFRKHKPIEDKAYFEGLYTEVLEERLLRKARDKRSALFEAHPSLGLMRRIVKTIR